MTRQMTRPRPDLTFEPIPYVDRFGRPVSLLTKHDVWQSRCRILTRAHVSPDGAIRWDRTGRCVPLDVLRNAYVTGWELTHTPIHNAEQAENLARYRAAREGEAYDAETLAEIRAEFGDTAVVDVITGKPIKK